MLSDAVLLAIVASVPPTLAAVASLIVSLRNSHKVDEIKKNTDGLMAARVQAEGDKQIEVGKAIGVESERVRSGV